MESVRAQLDALASEYERLLAQVNHLEEDNSRLNEELLAAGLPGQGGSRLSPRFPLAEESAGVPANDSLQSQSTSPTAQSTLRRDSTRTQRESNIELWQIWADDMDADPSSTTDQHTPATVSSELWECPVDPNDGERRTSKKRTTAAVAGDLEMDDSCLQPCVLKPSDRQRLAWDIASIFALSYDVIMLPLAIFSTLETVRWVLVVNVCTTTFWLSDILVSFFTGYYAKGRVELRPWKIAVRYLKSWFFLDVFLSSLDIILLIALHDSVESFSIFRFGKFSRFARALRLFRLVRALKVLSALRKRADVIKSDIMRTLLSIVQLLVAMVICNHFVACGWYGIGTMDVLPSDWPTWVKQLNLDDEGFAGRDDPYFYTTALHWSFTQFTPASMEIVPRNALERSYNIVILILGLVMFSSLISSITNAMTKLRERNTERAQQQESLSEYFQIHRVSLDLNNHVYSFLRQQGFSTNKRPIANDIPVLNKLPERLRRRLHGEVYSPILISHPFFYHFKEADGQSLLAVCHLAMSQFNVLEGQHLFQLGETAGKMYFISDGAMEYFLGVSDSPAALVRRYDHISEAPLWVKWVHKGRADAERNAEVAALDAQAFHGVMRNTRLISRCRNYARNFCTKTIELGEDLTDLPCSFDDIRDLLQFVFESSNLSMVATRSISSSVSKRLRRSRRL